MRFVRFSYYKTANCSAPCGVVQCGALLISKSLISERKKPCGPKMIVLVRIPQAQNSGTEQPTSKVNGQTSNMATGTELVVLGDSYFFESATFTIPFPHSDSDSER